MQTKISDIKLALKKGLREKNRVNLLVRRDYGDRRYKMQKIIRKIKSKVQDERVKLWNKYESKINHYRSKREMAGLIDHKKPLDNKKFIKPSIPPDPLKEYASLSIFGDSKDLPTAKASLGPFICDPNLKLTTEEFEILSKDPKFCLAYEPTDVEFQTEVERMLAKERYDYNSKKHKKRLDITAGIANIDIDIEGRERKDIKYKEKERTCLMNLKIA